VDGRKEKLARGGELDSWGGGGGGMVEEGSGGGEGTRGADKEERESRERGDYSGWRGNERGGVKGRRRWERVESV